MKDLWNAQPWNENIPNIVVIWDIDGTLINASQLHSRMYEKAFKIQFNQSIKKWPNYEGKTDRWLSQQLILENLGNIPNLEHETDMLLQSLSENYEENYQLETGTSTPNIEKVLDFLDQNRIPRGLVTGNTEKIAYFKLKAFHLEAGFRFGAFGEESTDRIHLLQNIKTRIRENLGSLPEKLIYVADTPIDMNAAHATNMLAVAVLTGNKREHDFREENPELILPNLENPNFSIFVDFLQELT